MENQLSLEVNGHPVDLKSRTEDVVSGWAILAFTPVCSLRSTKVGTEGSRIHIAKAIISACGGFADDPELYQTIARQIADITVDYEPDA